MSLGYFVTLSDVLCLQTELPADDNLILVFSAN